MNVTVLAPKPKKQLVIEELEKGSEKYFKVWIRGIRHLKYVEDATAYALTLCELFVYCRPNKTKSWERTFHIKRKIGAPFKDEWEIHLKFKGCE